MENDRKSEADSGHHSSHTTSESLRPVIQSEELTEENIKLYGDLSSQSENLRSATQSGQLTSESQKCYGSWEFHDGRLIGQDQSKYNSNNSSNNNSPSTSHQDISSSECNDDKRQNSDRSSDDPENSIYDFKDYKRLCQSNSGSGNSSNNQSSPGSGSSSSNDLTGSASNLILRDPRTQMWMEQLQRQQNQVFQQHQHQEFQESKRLVKNIYILNTKQYVILHSVFILNLMYGYTISVHSSLIDVRCFNTVYLFLY